MASSPQDELASTIAELSARPDRESVASELQVLQSIYGDDAIRLWRPPAREPQKLRYGDSTGEAALRYEAELSLPSPHDAISIRVLVSIPAAYPAASPPQLQLLSRYIGAFGADAPLFGAVLRTFISVSGVEWAPGAVCVFDGLASVVERCAVWYEERLSAEKAGELVRGDAKMQLSDSGQQHRQHPDPDPDPDPEVPLVVSALPDGLELFTAEPIMDRKSAFVGRACRVTHPSQVPLVLAYLMADRRIARAAHPVINAWRCQVGALIHQDNDDDGETAAGGRLAHLLQILEVNNVLVVVTRYFGGIHLGPDRFKHINQAARNALDVGGFLDVPVGEAGKRSVGRGKRH